MSCKHRSTNGRLVRRIALILGLIAAAALPQEWIRTLDSGSREDDEAVALALDDSGGAYVTGKMGRNSYTFTGTAKFSTMGERRWLTAYDPFPGFDQKGRNISVERSGNVLVASASRDSDDVWCFATIKYATVGTELWTTRYSDTAHYSDFPYDITVTPRGRYVVTGMSSRNTADADLATVCYDSAGFEEWVRRYDGPTGGIDRAYAVATDSVGSAFVVGYVSGLSWMHAIVIKYSSGGQQGWLNIYAPPNEHTTYRAVALDSRGNVLATGYQGPVYTKFLTVKLNPDGDTLWTRLYYRGTGVDILTDGGGNTYVAGTDNQSGSNSDIIALKYDSAGNLQWDARYNGPDQMQDWGYALALGPDGSVYVCGSSQSAEHGTECILIKYDSLGDTVWTARISGFHGGGAAGNAVAVDTDGNVVVAGYAHGGLSGKDYLIAKYPPSGPGVEEPRKPMLVTRHAIAVVPSVVSSRCIFNIRKSEVLSSLGILDISGRTVQEFALPPGETCVAWNVTDGLGRPVPNGVYFAVLESPESRTTAKFLIQR